MVKHVGRRPRRGIPNVLPTDTTRYWGCLSEADDSSSSSTDTFDLGLNPFNAISRLMIDRDHRFDWLSYLRCSNADEEAVELMARSICNGCSSASSRDRLKYSAT
jgi:hypothetical protein